jgi:7-carboxy-7-deazaguanine synthase
MKINEIFYSIQGEGKWTGHPNIFLRLTGCNLRCSYCDTQYAYEEGTEKSIQEIKNEILKFKCKKICITGGEPLIQEDILQLIDILIEKNYEISIETNGSIDIKSLTKKDNLMISMDVKCPSSKMHKKMNLKNIILLKKKDQLKLIIANKKDYDFAKKILKEYKPNCDVFIQPVWGSDPQILANWILRDNLNVKLGLQLHKIIFRD